MDVHACARSSVDVEPSAWSCSVLMWASSENAKQSHKVYTVSQVSTTKKCNIAMSCQ